MCEDLQEGTSIDHDGYTTCDKCGGIASLIGKSHIENGSEIMDWEEHTCENEGCLSVNWIPMRDEK